ncbi:MAG TPA: tRNA (adenosine(37)-N6)-threonylcarbamoyltransferase complex transferase subunit TsaD [Candidatus Paceibacterota bacterium]
MKILGIETSCDETAVCLIEAEGSFGASFKFQVLGNALHSQIATHAPYGGIFPNLAKREHAKNLVPLLSEVLAQSAQAVQGPSLIQLVQGRSLNIRELLVREPELFQALEEFLKTHGRPDIDAIAVTHGPGLEPALWVGVNFAKALSAVWNIPIVPVNHLEGHIAMAIVSNPDTSLYNEVSGLRIDESGFPAIALLISGGHTELDLITEWPKFKTIGETRDDAVGEAFDKIARMMGLPYPGGPEIARLASRSRQIQEVSPLELPRPMMKDESYDFSFSGLKTAVRNVIGGRTLTYAKKIEIAREFEDAAADVLVAKTLRAVEEHGAQTVLVGGGVSANTHIKQRLKEALDEQDVQLLIPAPEWATDNALMIALAGYFHALKKEFADPASLRASGNLRLANV